MTRLTPVSAGSNGANHASPATVASATVWVPLGTRTGQAADDLISFQ